MHQQWPSPLQGKNRSVCASKLAVLSVENHFQVHFLLRGAAGALRILTLSGVTCTAHAEICIHPARWAALLSNDEVCIKVNVHTS